MTRSGKRKDIEELKHAIARVAALCPKWDAPFQNAGRKSVRPCNTNQAYLPLEEVMELCRAHGMDNEELRLFITIEHRLGHLIHYEHDPALQDIVVLKPDWLATAISFVLDDERLARLWIGCLYSSASIMG